MSNPNKPMKYEAILFVLLVLFLASLFLCQGWWASIL